MGIIDKWNTFALKKIKFNDRIEISVGRMILGIIIFLIAEFTTFPVAWIFLIFGLKIKKKNNNKEKEVEKNGKNR